MRIKIYLKFILAVILPVSCFSQTGIIDYLGLTPPGDSAIVLTTDLIPKDYNIFGIVLSPLDDELFVTIYKENLGTILHSRRTGFVWSKLDTAFYALEKGLETVTISPDGQLLTYVKSNPLAGWPYNTDLYFCNRTDNGWSKAQLFSAAINSEFREAGHALTSSRTLYFATGRPTDDQKADIFKVECIDGEYTSVEYVPNLSTAADEDGIWVSPDESYAIVESWQDENKKDFFISFHNEDGSWTTLKNMGPKINTPGFEGTPRVTYDGKYLFFWSDRTGNYCLHWIRVDKIISDLKI
jgi:hypothetical protein